MTPTESQSDESQPDGGDSSESPESESSANEDRQLALRPRNSGGYGMHITEEAKLLGWEQGDNILLGLEGDTEAPDILLGRVEEPGDRTRTLNGYTENGSSVYTLRIPPFITSQFTDTSNRERDKHDPPMFQPTVSEEQGAFMLEYVGRQSELEEAEQNEAAEMVSQLTGVDADTIEENADAVAAAVKGTDEVPTVEEYPPLRFERDGIELVFVEEDAFEDIATEADLDADEVEAVKMYLNSVIEDDLEAFGETEYRGFDRVSVPVYVPLE